MTAAARTPEAIEASKLLFLGIGFSLVWIAIAGYLFSLSRRQKALEKRLESLAHTGPEPPNNDA